MAESMQPLSPSPDPETGLVQAFHPGASYEVLPDSLDTKLPCLCRPAAQVVQGAGAQAHAEHVQRELGQPLIGQELDILQIDRPGRQARPVLHRCPVWPPRRRLDRRRWLRVQWLLAGGFAGPSLDGGFPLLLLWRPKLRHECCPSSCAASNCCVNCFRAACHRASFACKWEFSVCSRVVFPCNRATSACKWPSLACRREIPACKCSRRDLLLVRCHCMARRRLRRVLMLRLARYGLDVRKVLHATASPPNSQGPLRLLIVARDPTYPGSYQSLGIPASVPSQGDLGVNGRGRTTVFGSWRFAVHATPTQALPANSTVTEH